MGPGEQVTVWRLSNLPTAGQTQWGDLAMFEAPPESAGLFQQFYAIVALIPRGRVATYGQIARMMGHPRAARMVGWALHGAPADLPCHRVVNRDGRTAPGWPEQHVLLLEEGVAFRPDGRVDLEAHLWEGSTPFSLDAWPGGEARIRGRG